MNPHWFLSCPAPVRGCLMLWGFTYNERANWTHIYSYIYTSHIYIFFSNRQERFVLRFISLVIAYIYMYSHSPPKGEWRIGQPRCPNLTTPLQKGGYHHNWLVSASDQQCGRLSQQVLSTAYSSLPSLRITTIFCHVFLRPIPTHRTVSYCLTPYPSPGGFVPPTVYPISDTAWDSTPWGALHNTCAYL